MFLKLMSRDPLKNDPLNIDLVKLQILYQKGQGLIFSSSNNVAGNGHFE